MYTIKGSAANIYTSKDYDVTCYACHCASMCKKTLCGTHMMRMYWCCANGVHAQHQVNIIRCNRQMLIAHN